MANNIANWKSKTVAFQIEAFNERSLMENNSQDLVI